MGEQVIGIIGGSGLYNIEGIEGVKSVSIDTPFGKPSDSFTIGPWKVARWLFCRGTVRDIRSYHQNLTSGPIFTG